VGPGDNGRNPVSGAGLVPAESKGADREGAVKPKIVLVLLIGNI
jgi:hypothetical protein